MAFVGEDDPTVHKVVVNDEEQYSIWPADRHPPAGWASAGCEGPRAECLAWIDRVWLDMRPRGVRLREGRAPG